MAIDVEELKKRIAGLTKIGGKRQYSAALKRDVLEYVTARVSEGASEAAACNELELYQPTVTGWRGRALSTSTIRPVELTKSTTSRTIVVVLPGGARVEGLELRDIAELVRSLA